MKSHTGHMFRFFLALFVAVLMAFGVANAEEPLPVFDPAKQDIQEIKVVFISRLRKVLIDTDEAEELTLEKVTSFLQDKLPGVVVRSEKG